jgi:hypothetical protein
MGIIPLELAKQLSQQQACMLGYSVIILGLTVLGFLAWKLSKLLS